MAKIRIATVKATGKKYIVQQWFGGKVHCWGELVSYKGLSTKHGESKSFLEDFVTLETVDQNQSLVESLFAQAVQVKEEAGKTLVHHKNSVTVYDSPEHVEKVKEFRQERNQMKKLIRQDPQAALDQILKRFAK